MQTTEFELLGLTITEPFTWLTNWSVAFFSFYFAYLLYRASGKLNQKVYWSYFFFFMGIASLTGGAAHGFFNYLGNTFHYAAWVFTGISVFWAQSGTLELIKGTRLYQILRLVILIELVLMILAVVFYQSFEAVRINSALGLLGLVLPLQLYGFKKLNIRGHGIILLGIISLGGPALIHAAKFSYNRWINFNDLSHIVMIGCFYLMYLGVSKLQLAEDKIDAA